MLDEDMRGLNFPMRKLFPDCHPLTTTILIGVPQ
jgi:hypothetical protein